MRTARLIFQVAGIYGLTVVTPLFFLESTVNTTSPPAITHPEYYYGFVCVTFAWQVLYMVLASDPARYRPLMLLGVLEKTSGVAFIILVLLHRAPTTMLIGIPDVIFGGLFLYAYRITDPKLVAQTTGAAV